MEGISELKIGPGKPTIANLADSFASRSKTAVMVLLDDGGFWRGSSNRWRG
jgi:hypothetical protein